MRLAQPSLHLPVTSLSGVADQLQTNYASDLRSILKTLFEVMATKPETDDKEKLKKGERHCRTGSAARAEHHPSKATTYPRIYQTKCARLWTRGDE